MRMSFHHYIVFAYPVLLYQFSVRFTSLPLYQDRMNI